MFAEAPFLRTTDLKHVEITPKHIIMIWSILQSFKAQLAWTVNFSTKTWCFQLEIQRTTYKKRIKGESTTPLHTFIPGFRLPLISAGPPGVMELIIVPRSWRPEISPPTTWKPERNKTTHFTLLCLATKRQMSKEILLKLSFEHIIKVFLLSVIDTSYRGRILIRYFRVGRCITGHALFWSGTH